MPACCTTQAPVRSRWWNCRWSALAAGHGGFEHHPERAPRLPALLVARAQPPGQGVRPRLDLLDGSVARGVGPVHALAVQADGAPIAQGHARCLRRRGGVPIGGVHATGQGGQPEQGRAGGAQDTPPHMACIVPAPPMGWHPQVAQTGPHSARIQQKESPAGPGLGREALGLRRRRRAPSSSSSWPPPRSGGSARRKRRTPRPARAASCRRSRRR
ncbi:MAG: hypothetical protein K0R89_2095 [Ramlibacter sp.]|nr:hypothetical protein [Ramlibacter sp.]